MPTDNDYTKRSRLMSTKDHHRGRYGVPGGDTVGRLMSTDLSDRDNRPEGDWGWDDLEQRWVPVNGETVRRPGVRVTPALRARSRQRQLDEEEWWQMGYEAGRVAQWSDDRTAMMKLRDEPMDDMEYGHHWLTVAIDALKYP